MISLNMQPSESLISREDGVLEVVDVFHTIQGEGPFSGMPAVFVRLAGCNLACPDCDTNYTTGRTMYPPTSLANECEDLVPKALGAIRTPDLVVITGGEPFRQRLAPFVRKLLERGWKVQIETNGTVHERHFPYEEVTLVVSPKVGRVHPELQKHVKHLKYVIEDGRVSDHHGLPTSVLGNIQQVAPPWSTFKGTIWVQPADMADDDNNKANLRKTVEIAKTFGYRVSLQTHKIMGVQ